MQVKLKVLGGSNAGKEIKIPLAKFFIGRGEDCHLRPQSDMISRHHCAILIENGTVTIRDLKSRNGTIVNGEKIAGDVALKLGDKVKVGPLEFEVLIDHAAAGNKKPKVVDVKDAAARVVQTQAEKETATIDDDISSWLDDNEDDDHKYRSHETRQFRFDTSEVKGVGEETGTNPIITPHDTGKQASPAADTSTTKGKKPAEKAEKKVYGKLPKAEHDSSVSSRDAAADMLKKFFNRR